jgi:hypothetical protein
MRLVDGAEVEMLAANRDRLKRAYGKAVANLFEVGYMATPVEYRQLRMMVADAKHDLELAQKALAGVELQASPSPAA